MIKTTLGWLTTHPSTTIPPTEWILSVTTPNAPNGGSKSVFRVNGKNLKIQNPTDTNSNSNILPNNVCINCFRDELSDFELAEVIIIDSTADKDIINTLEAYFANKYGLTMDEQWKPTCIACEAGKSSTTGESCDITCPAGTFSTVADSAKGCQKCPVGSYSNADTISGLSGCTLAPAGYYTATPGTGNSAILACPAGTASKIGSSAASACVDCEVGKYNTSPNAASISGVSGCAVAPAGYYTATPGTGNSAILACPAGTASKIGSSAASDCSTDVYICSVGTVGTMNDCPIDPTATSIGANYKSLVKKIMSVDLSKLTLLETISDNTFSNLNLQQLFTRKLDAGLLTSLNLGSSVRVIGESAFANNQINVIEIPDSVVEISKSAFSYNYIKTLTFGSRVENIGDSAFAYTLQL